MTELYDRRVDAVISRHTLDDDVGGMAGAIVPPCRGGPRRPRRIAGRSRRCGRCSAAWSCPDTPAPTPAGGLGSASSPPACGPSPTSFVAAPAARRRAGTRATREQTVEVAHEALLTRWSRLVGWVDEDRRWLAQLQHLSGAARAWDEAGRGDGELYRGARLEAAIEALDEDSRAVTLFGARSSRPPARPTTPMSCSPGGTAPGGSGG